MRPHALSRGLRACARGALLPLLAAGVLVSSSPRAARAQQLATGFERERWRSALVQIRDDIKKNYYDPSYHGIDIEEHFKKAEEKMKAAQTVGQIFGIIAQALLDFDDSHLFFAPPSRANRYDYGWRMQMIGDRCFVTAVKPGSDAEAKGLRPGDELNLVDGYRPTRGNHWKMQYLYYSLRPMPGMRLNVTKPDGKQQQLDAMAKIKQGKRVLDLTGMSGGGDLAQFWREEERDENERREGSRAVSLGENQLLVWKLKEFAFTEAEIDDAMSKARKHKALVIDLRGNGGGAEKTLLRMLGNIFDRDVKLGDIRRRKEEKPLVAKTRGGDNVFKGDLVVLVDSQSGSASELFARVIQLEKRGTVLGDRTAGAVMRSKFYGHESGLETVAFYGASVTDADIVMSDGKSLEHVGVTPDKVLLPTADDLAAGRDAVLAQAAALLGFQLDPERAGALFPVKWQK
jgi:C-terminal processing protease CtpA/Prc